ncbi:hypothetical protein BRADI_2g27914v3 [Brachypodium distachyon]|uniref:Uncharacterized protein n=1 Tax=Brachypodium distachyon TaxID=15368 RepID=A0A2K2DB10_BRADI|nr:hypothetical protein BRADI_2g27914v3 [Brachypodium distachyon]
MPAIAPTHHAPFPTQISRARRRRSRRRDGSVETAVESLVSTHGPPAVLLFFLPCLHPMNPRTAGKNKGRNQRRLRSHRRGGWGWLLLCSCAHQLFV